MLPAAFSVTFDHEQTRVKEQPKVASSRGAGFNHSVFEDAWIEPVTGTLMLRPACKYDDFYSSNAGIYAKPAKAAYEFATAADWEEVEVYVGAGKYMRCKDAVGEYARTVTAPGQNRGVFLSFMNYGAGDLGDVCTFGWDNTDTTTTGSEIGVAVGGSGACLVYKDGAYVGAIDTGSMPMNEFVHLLVMPMRTRELMILNLVTNRGGSVVFDDIAEGATTFEITPGEKFWWKPAAAATNAQVQIVPCNFDTSGFATTSLITFTRPPASGASLATYSNPIFTGITNASVYGAKAGAGTTNVSAVALVESDGATTFVPDGTADQVRIKLTMTGDGSYTPFVYGAVMAYAGTTHLTNATEEATPDSYLMALSLDVPDSAFEGKMSLAYRNPATVGTSVKKLEEVSARPVKLEVGSLVLLDGRTMPTRFIEGTTDDSSRALIECRDMAAALDAAQYRDEIPYDGYELSQPTGSGDSAVRQILKFAGLSDSQMDLSDASFLLPEVPGQRGEEWSFATAPGDTARSLLEELHQEFAADWFMGTRPSASGPVFAFLDPADLPATPAVTLYSTQAEAVSVGGIAAADAWKYVFRTYETQAEEVDANEVWATGLDPRTNELVQSYIVDTASQDATTAPSSRPDNWLGEPKAFGVVDPRLRTQADTDKAVELLSPVVTERRTVGQFESVMLWYNSDPGGTDVMLPVWRGDLVTLYGVGNVRITSFSVKAERNNASHLVTSAVYTFGGLTHNGGNDLRSIQKRNAARRARSLFDVRRNPFTNVLNRRVRRNSV